MYYHEQEKPEGDVREINFRTMGFSLLCHAALGLVFLSFSFVISWLHPHETIIPIDMTVVPPWAEQDPDDPNPDPNPPPKELPKPVEKAPPAPDPIPKAEEKVDALEKIPEKPKPKEKKFTKAKLEEQKKPEKPKEKKFTKAKLEEQPKSAAQKPRKADAPDNLPPGKGTSRDKPLTAKEFEKALADGARIGAKNELPTSEEQRCIAIIKRTFHENWTGFTWYDGLKPVLLRVRFGPGGRLTAYSIHVSSGDKAVDQTVLAAAKRVGAVQNLSAAFLEKHAEITIRMCPEKE